MDRERPRDVKKLNFPDSKNELDPRSRGPRLKLLSSNNKIYILILAVALIAGTSTGYFLASNGSSSSNPAAKLIDINNEQPQTAAQDNRTFRDFAEGKIAPKPQAKAGDYSSEGTHLLIREGAVPVALTSSVVDLSLYEGKNVKVLGETQKALKEGWLMDVGKVEEK